MTSWGDGEIAANELRGGGAVSRPPLPQPGSRGATRARSNRAAQIAGGLACAGLLLFEAGAWAPAFLGRADPAPGATVATPPKQVRIWFDGPIEPLFLGIRVENRDKQRVDKGDGRVNPADATLLEVGVPPLLSGRYRVFWSVVARDGHRKEGDFPFRVK